MTNSSQELDRKAVVDALNSLEVIESNGGEEAYVLVKNSQENRDVLQAVGISEKTIHKYGDDETFCIMALGFGENFIDLYDGNKLLCFEESLEIVLDEKRDQSIVVFRHEGETSIIRNDGCKVIGVELTDEQRKALVHLLT